MTLKTAFKKLHLNLPKTILEKMALVPPSRKGGFLISDGNQK
jgi:hypothetical protein